MGQIPIEQYFEKLRKGKPEYQWPLERIGERQTKREKIHEEFPYIITYSGNYGYGGGWLLDDMKDWCRKQFGDEHGECHWHGCEWDWDRWHRESGLEEELDRDLDARGKRPVEKEKKALKKWQDVTSKIIDEHFEMMKTRFDAPDDHSHWGTWTSFFVCKTGYDYGYKDYCFKNLEDAFYFKLMWAEEAERRG